MHCRNDDDDNNGVSDDTMIQAHIIQNVFSVVEKNLTAHLSPCVAHLLHVNTHSLKNN